MFVLDAQQGDFVKLIKCVSTNTVKETKDVLVSGALTLFTIYFTTINQFKATYFKFYHKINNKICFYQSSTDGTG